MNQRRIIIVGPSGSGKTTVGQAVARELGNPLISMDDFRTRGRRTAPMIDVGDATIRTYEDPCLWDGNAIACKLTAFVRAGVGFVAEGNHLLYYPAIRALPRLELFYLDVPFAVSVARRKARHRGVPSDFSFAQIGERETERWVKPQLAARGMVLLDGNELPHVNGNKIVHYKHDW